MIMCKKILVIGGVHGNELSGIQLVQLLKELPLQSVDTLIANPLAVQKNVRFVEQNLNQCFSDNSTDSYENNQAIEIKQILNEYDYILDFHNTTSDKNTCLITTQLPNSVHLHLSEILNIKNIVIMPKGGSLIGYNSEKAISIEISNTDKTIYSTDYLYSKIKLFTTSSGPKKKPSVCDKFRFVANVYYKDIPNSFNIKEIVNFTPLTTSQKIQLGLVKSMSIYPVFYGEESYEGIAFQIVEKLMVNDY
jgi:hypothetical protein